MAGWCECVPPLMPLVSLWRHRLGHAPFRRAEWVARSGIIAVDVSQMTEDQKIILEKIIACGGRVDTKTFRGSGQIVAGMIRRGWVEWERGNMPRTLNATALLITDLGKLAAYQ